jgi:hypothetical protein
MPLHPKIELTVKLDSVTGNHENDRNALRTLLLDSLVGEKAGTGKGENTSKYRYDVESLSCGSKIYLTRPVTKEWNDSAMFRGEAKFSNLSYGFRNIIR